MRIRWISRKGIAATLVILTLALLLLNIASWVAMRVIYKVNIYDKTKYEAYKNALIIDNRKGSIVHPYIGKLELQSENFDNLLSSEPLFKRVDKSSEQNQIRILLLGGSVAQNMSWYPEIGEHGIFYRIINSRFPGNRFSVYMAAIGGGKQPQQYLKLVYLDLLGFHPDIVINYDGFNEIALPIGENEELGNPAIFPRLFSAHIDASSNEVRSCSNLSNYLISLDSNIPFVDLLASFYGWRCWSAIQRRTRPWWADEIKSAEATTYAQKSREIWRTSSNKIHDFTRARDIDYIHVLQPNQYYPDSKVLSDLEKKRMDYPRYGEPIKNYYGLLSKEGIRTKNFHDQRLLFKSNSATVYNDNCCHFTKEGMELIIDDLITVFYHVFETRLRRADQALPRH